jgi:hypothetical protein
VVPRAGPDTEARGKIVPSLTQLNTEDFSTFTHCKIFKIYYIFSTYPYMPLYSILIFLGDFQMSDGCYIFITLGTCDFLSHNQRE